MACLNIRVETFLLPLGEITGGHDDLFQATVRVINPDQTGLMTHTEVRRANLEAFWSGVDAIARTWMPAGVSHPDATGR